MLVIEKLGIIKIICWLFLVTYLRYLLFTNPKENFNNLCLAYAIE